MHNLSQAEIDESKEYQETREKQYKDRQRHIAERGTFKKNFGHLVNRLYSKHFREF